MQKNILVTGGTGFIGGHFCRRAVTEGHRVHVLTRNIDGARPKLPETVQLVASLDKLPSNIHIVLNMAGEPLVSGRWNATRKAQFRDSRIGVTQALLDHFNTTPDVPELLISGSAIGYYGPHNDRVLDESGAYKACFSHQLCSDWEQQALAFRELGTRVCCMRTGIVLGKGEGALARMLPAYKLGLGGPIGRGNQWMSWIHIDDMVSMLFHCMARRDLSGAINATAPHPVRNEQFSKTLGQVLKRPAFFRMPAFVAKLLFGQMAEELLLTGQRVIPRKAQDMGFSFRFPELSEALADLI